MPSGKCDQKVINGREYMRVVLDTNILISALLFKGEVGRMFDLIEEEVIIPCFIPSTVKELSDVMSRDKFKRNMTDLQLSKEEIIENVLGKSYFSTEPTKDIVVIKNDPSDNKFLGCALACQASFIVSGDKHLLSLEKFRKIPIISPSKFLKNIYLGK